MQFKSLFAFCLCVFYLLSGCKPSDHSKNISQNKVNISATRDPEILDPRVARSLEAATPLQMIYEGLLRSDFQGHPSPGVAEKYTVSDDLKTYTFHLRKSFWSNGDPVNAENFAQTWKQILDPRFSTPTAYQFYVIRGAKAAKEGKIPFEKTGIKIQDPHTLVIELEEPTPYFLDLLTTHFFLPVHPENGELPIISNGPFKLESWEKGRKLIFVKNPNYWDANEVSLDQVNFLIMDEYTALKQFETGELEWVGAPLGSIPQEALATLRHRHQLRLMAASKVHWFRINTKATPFISIKLRQSFAYALNRKAIIQDALKGIQRPATSITPSFFGLTPYSFFKDNNVPKAWYTFQESLEELNISKDEFPSITLCYSPSERNQKIVELAKEQWSKTLGVDVALESCALDNLYERLSTHQYQIAYGGWCADYRDPMNFLEVFKYTNNSTNNTEWENQEYIDLLNQSNIEKDSSKRLEILRNAEAILMENMPVIPLFFGVFNYVKYENLYGVYFSELGYLDFKYAFYGE